MYCVYLERIYIWNDPRRLWQPTVGIMEELVFAHLDYCDKSEVKC